MKMQFQQQVLDALLGDARDDFDIEGIIDEATRIDWRGNRVWRDMSFGEFYMIVEKHRRIDEK